VRDICQKAKEKQLIRHTDTAAHLGYTKDRLSNILHNKYTL